MVIGSIQWRYDMKKIVIFIAIVVLVLLAVAACGPSDNAVEIAQAKSVIEAARAAQDAARAAQIASQGLSDVGRGQTLILILLTLVVALLIGMAAYSVIQRQCGAQPGSAKEHGRWMSGPNALEAGEARPYQQLLLQQQMLNQLAGKPGRKSRRRPAPTACDWWG
jgi:hypothetical protein